MKETRLVEYSEKISINHLQIPKKTNAISIDGKQIHLTKSKTHFPGLRNWFLCPQCQSRVGVLYRPPSKTQFLCRNCHYLFYWDQVWKPSRFAG